MSSSGCICPSISRHPHREGNCRGAFLLAISSPASLRSEAHNRFGKLLGSGNVTHPLIVKAESWSGAAAKEDRESWRSDSQYRHKGDGGNRLTRTKRSVILTGGNLACNNKLIYLIIRLLDYMNRGWYVEYNQVIVLNFHARDNVGLVLFCNVRSCSFYWNSSVPVK